MFFTKEVLIVSKRILFQGDSITDCSRDREKFYDMGHGYARFVAGALGLDYPGEYEFINRGVSGNRVTNLYDRRQADFIDLKPDYLSIYIGVNDALCLFYNTIGVETERYERVYAELVDDMLAACPDVKIMLITPFVAEGSITCNTDMPADLFERLHKDVCDKAEAAKRLAAKYGFPVIDLQAAFDEACKKAPVSYWTVDGVHPTAPGHEIIKRMWIETFEKMK